LLLLLLLNRRKLLFFSFYKKHFSRLMMSSLQLPLVLPGTALPTIPIIIIIVVCSLLLLPQISDSTAMTAGHGNDGAKYFPCEFCGSTLNSAQSLGGHMNRHRGDRAWTS
jgi:hypothetical protein